MIHRLPAAALLLLLLEPCALAEDAPEPRKLSIGVTDLGGQVRWHVRPDWAAEARFITGKASSNEGQIHSFVLGLRGYRFFPERRRCRLYLGLEGARAQTSIQQVQTGPGSSPIPTIQGFGDTSGYAFGGFGGLEFRPARRVAVDLDMGPYVIDLKEKITGTSGSSWDFVLNAAINLYLF